MTTRITEDNITPGSITANSLAEGISLGGGGGVTIDQIIVTDSEFSNTANTQILSSGPDYFKIYGSGFQANANVYLSTNFALTTLVTANVVSSNEVRVTTGNLGSIATFNLFLINTNGTIATKLASLSSYASQPTASWISGSPSTVDKIVFSSDTNTSSVRGPLSSGRAYAAASSSLFYGWFGGGSGTSIVDRINFGSDTDIASVRGPLSVERDRLAATGNDNYGWFGGGFPRPKSNIDRIDYGTDTATASIRGPLSQAKQAAGATGNNNYGWFGGGYVPGVVSTVNRIDYSADVSTAAVRGPLSLSRIALSASGNDNYGWFGGGTVSPITSIVDRIDFAADTGTASVRGPLNAGRTYLASSGNKSSFTYFMGGNSLSIVDRVDLSADTGTASVRGPLSAGRSGSTSASGVG
jgi:hypothetical protein